MSAETERSTEKQRQYFKLKETDMLYKDRAESLFFKLMYSLGSHHVQLLVSVLPEVQVDSVLSYSGSHPNILPTNVLSH